MSADLKIQVCREFDYANGIVLNLEDGSSQTTIHAPHTAFPSPFPRSCFYEAYALAVPFHDLYRRVAADRTFLHDALDSAAKSDTFTAKLLGILDAVDDRYAQPIQCAVLRSDYMLHKSPMDGSVNIKQVEINTISASFAGLSARVTKLHRHVLRKLRPEINARLVPENFSDSGVARTLYEGWRAYGRKDAVVVFVVQEREKNKYDQLHVQDTLSDEYGVTVVRHTLQELGKMAELKSAEGNRKLLFLHGSEVALVYFRAGYGPGDYTSDADWETRKTIELSFAIKVPTVAWQLAGAKKVQQVLAKGEVLTKFTSLSKVISASFVGLSALDEASVARAIDHPADYVLKPQREGGGNNLYGEDLKKFLLSAPQSDWPAYILMEMIRSEPFPAEIVRNNTISSGLCISEIGVYSGLVFDGTTGRDIVSEPLGHLLRTKFSTSNETGVSAGFGALDSPMLQ